MQPHTDRPLSYYGLVRVRVEPGGRLVPLWYGVGSEHDFFSATVVDGEYTIAFCGLPSARTRDEAHDQLEQKLPWWRPLLGDAIGPDFECTRCGEVGFGTHVCGQFSELAEKLSNSSHPATNEEPSDGERR